MGYTTTWKVLEDFMLELKKRGVDIPPEVINDLRSAKLMIKICESPGGKGDTALKIDEYLGNVESYLIADASRILRGEDVDQWIKRIDEASAEASCEETLEQDKFITGVPRDQKWVRVEPDSSLTEEKITQIAKDCNLSFNKQKDGRLVVYGQKEDLKEFLKKMTAEATKKQ
jgi:hypothetical protein